MGEVFRAHDTTLNRDVAIKVLPKLFAADPDRLARFTREAQTLAALNHPNIAHIHGFENSGGVRSLIMELVEGDDLSLLIARGPMLLADAVPIARQIADALEAAHEQGIVHRDLKPANVKVRADGTVKVLDFVGVMYLLTPSATVLPAAAGPLHVSLTLPDGDEVTDKNLLPLDISPDGTRVAYVGLRDDVRRLFLRNLADKEPVLLVGTEGARSPFFSPDGRWIGFFAQGKLNKAAVGGGAVQVVADNVPEPRGGTWSTDGSIYYTPTNTAGIWKVSASGGGPPSEVTRLDRSRGYPGFNAAVRFPDRDPSEVHAGQQHASVRRQLGL
ncbi:MAG: serine/threonine-protein kinase [Acidobacteria bacterium]|nr:serine/threonine-protein kinase [Acidobacteriota bacterium]MBA3884231.1 serine/threonine-protein kinase [Acidobacteriota bacterium]